MAFMTLGELRQRLLVHLMLEGEKPVGPQDATELLKRFPKGLRSLGINVEDLPSLSVLGTGTRGTAFDLGNGKVLKVTNDEREAHAAATLVGKNLPNVVRFYAVKRLGDTSAYCILQEKLDPLPAEDGKLLNKALVATGLPIWIKRAQGSWDEAKRLTKAYVVKQVKEKFKDNLNSPEAQEFARSLNEQWNLLVKRFGLRSMFETLTELGIDFHDYHAGNLMIRPGDGTIVLIDLGMSKIRGEGGKIETINQAMQPS